MSRWSSFNLFAPLELSLRARDEWIFFQTRVNVHVIANDASSVSSAFNSFWSLRFNVPAALLNMENLRADPYGCLRINQLGFSISILSVGLIHWHFLKTPIWDTLRAVNLHLLLFSAYNIWNSVWIHSEVSCLLGFNKEKGAVQRAKCAPCRKLSMECSLSHVGLPSLQK